MRTAFSVVKAAFHFPLFFCAHTLARTKNRGKNEPNIKKTPSTPCARGMHTGVRQGEICDLIYGLRVIESNPDRGWCVQDSPHRTGRENRKQYPPNDPNDFWLGDNVPNRLGGFEYDLFARCLC